MKRFVEGEDRRQATLLPDSLEDYVTEDNPVRVVDADLRAKSERAPRVAGKRPRSEKSTRGVLPARSKGPERCRRQYRFDMSIAQSRQSAPGQPELTTVATRDVRQTSTPAVFAREDVAFAQTAVIPRLIAARSPPVGRQSPGCNLQMQKSSLRCDKRGGKARFGDE
jgi:hypothetical protein